MKNIRLTKNIPTLDFQESKLSRKDINTVKRFKSLVLDNGDDGIREISKLLKEKALNNFKVTNSEFKQADKLLNDLPTQILKNIMRNNLKVFQLRVLKQQKALNCGLSLSLLML